MLYVGVGFIVLFLAVLAMSRFISSFLTIEAIMPLASGVAMLCIAGCVFFGVGAFSKIHGIGQVAVGCLFALFATLSFVSAFQGWARVRRWLNNLDNLGKRAA